MTHDADALAEIARTAQLDAITEELRAAKGWDHARARQEARFMYETGYRTETDTEVDA